MVTSPELAEEANFVNGLAAVALFLVLAAVFVTAQFPAPEGFPEGVSIVASIGYAMFNLQPDGAVASEQFLAMFEIIDVVLVAALVAAVMLARHEGQGSLVTALTDGGRVEDGDDATSEGDPAVAGDDARGGDR